MSLKDTIPYCKVPITLILHKFRKGSLSNYMRLFPEYNPNGNNKHLNHDHNKSVFPLMFPLRKTTSSFFSFIISSLIPLLITIPSTDILLPFRHFVFLSFTL